MRSNRFRSTQNSLKHQNSWSAWKIDPKQVFKKIFFFIQFLVKMVKNPQFKWSGKKLSSVCAEFYAEHFCQCMSSAKMLPVENIFSPDIRTSGHPHIRTSGHPDIMSLRSWWLSKNVKKRKKKVKKNWKKNLWKKK